MWQKHQDTGARTRSVIYLIIYVITPRAISLNKLILHSESSYSHARRVSTLPHSTFQPLLAHLPAHAINILTHKMVSECMLRPALRTASHYNPVWIDASSTNRSGGSGDQRLFAFVLLPMMPRSSWKFVSSDGHKPPRMLSTVIREQQ